jgi:geranylgeranyl diphosphate synthase type II
MHRLKTGALIRAACRMGAIAGGAGGDALAAADAYGDAVGLAFQIADDLLDVTGTVERTGKRAGADAAAGRATYPAVVGVERARALANAEAERAVAAIADLERSTGPFRALARYAVERTS